MIQPVVLLEQLVPRVLLPSTQGLCDGGWFAPKLLGILLLHALLKVLEPLNAGFLFHLRAGACLRNI